MPWCSDLAVSAAGPDLLAISACSDDLAENGAKSRVGDSPWCLQLRHEHKPRSLRNRAEVGATFDGKGELLAVGQSIGELLL